jgi:hypothetical protein
VEHVISLWDDTQVTYATWIRFDFPSETPESYRERLLGRNKDRGDFPEIVAASTLLQRDIEIHDYKPGGDTLDCTLISTDDEAICTNDKIFLLRVNEAHYHALIPTPALSNDFPPPPKTLPNEALHESESEVRTRLAAYLKSIPGNIFSKVPSSNHAPLKRKREDKEASANGPSDLKDDLLSEDDEGDFEKTCGDPSEPIKVKRDRLVRRQDRSNRSEKNWTTAMKRHWNTKQKDIAMALITIKRDQIQEVKIH